MNFKNGIQAMIRQMVRNISCLGGGFKYFLFSPLLLGKIPNLTNIFQRGLKPPTSHVVFDHLLVERKFFFFVMPFGRPPTSETSGVIAPYKLRKLES